MSYFEYFIAYTIELAVKLYKYIIKNIPFSLISIQLERYKYSQSTVRDSAMYNICLIIIINVNVKNYSFLNLFSP